MCVHVYVCVHETVGGERGREEGVGDQKRSQPLELVPDNYKLIRIYWEINSGLLGDQQAE